MATNLERFKNDLKRLQGDGTDLQLAMFFDLHPRSRQDAQSGKTRSDKTEKALLAAVERIGNFSSAYQRWYSEALAVVRQVVPDRVADFQNHYLKPKNRKEISYENYRIEDYLQGLRVMNPVTREVIVGKSAAQPHLEQQCAILAAAAARFETSLYDIRQIVQADLFDSEIEAAEHLAKSRFLRAAGAIAGVVLEAHLGQVCRDRSIKVQKKNPTISSFNDALKSANVIDVPQWRFIQHLGDIRNLCDHAKIPEPTSEQIDDLIEGVRKAVKTIF